MFEYVLVPPGRVPERPAPAPHLSRVVTPMDLSTSYPGLAPRSKTSSSSRLVAVPLMARMWVDLLNLVY